MLRLHSARLSIFFLLVGALACEGEDASLPPSSQTSRIDELFTVDTVQLEELPGDSIGEVLFGLEINDDRFLVVERYRPRIHLYSSEGSLIASAGMSGAGPGEFKGITAAAVGPGGHVYVADIELSRISVLDSADLSFLGVVESPAPPMGPIAFIGDRMLVASLASRTGERFHLVRGHSIEWSAVPMPEAVHQQPYWINFVDHIVAKVGTTFVTSNSILYPLHQLADDGRVSDFGSPPPSFNRIPEVEPGAFSAGPRGDAFKRFLASFNVVGGLYALGEDYLAVVHSQFETHPLAYMLKTDQRLDLYRISDQVKVAEDVELPSGSDVLAGGGSLYIVVSKPPSPWRVLRLKVNSILAGVR